MLSKIKWGSIVSRDIIFGGIHGIEITFDSNDINKKTDVKLPILKLLGVIMLDWLYSYDNEFRAEIKEFEVKDWALKSEHEAVFIHLFSKLFGQASENIKVIDEGSLVWDWDQFKPKSKCIIV